MVARHKARNSVEDKVGYMCRAGRGGQGELCRTYGILQRAEGVIELSGRSNNDAARRTIQSESTGV